MQNTEQTASLTNLAGDMMHHAESYALNGVDAIDQAVAELLTRIGRILDADIAHCTSHVATDPSAII